MDEPRPLYSKTILAGDDVPEDKKKDCACILRIEVWGKYYVVMCEWLGCGDHSLLYVSEDSSESIERACEIAVMSFDKIAELHHVPINTGFRSDYE